MHFVVAIDELSRRTNYEATGGLVAPTLDRMRRLADLLDNPQMSFPSIHVTGTNGKGTTVEAATLLLSSLGLSVGTYTSPHLHSVRERIRFGGVPISEQEFADTYEYLAPYFATVDAEGSPVTWFEAMTAMSWVYFSERSVDAAVVEVGMGGTHDATNLIDGRVAVITRIALDHRELGDTTLEVAGEKAGIIKNDAIVVTGESDPAILELFRRTCTQHGATLRRIGAEFEVTRLRRAMSGKALDVRVGDHAYNDLFVPVWSEALATDAAIGLAAVEAFLGDRGMHEGAVREALWNLKMPGRVEVLSGNPAVVVDGAHNADAATALMRGLHGSGFGGPKNVVVGMLRDHFTPEFLRIVLQDAVGVIATQPPSPRAMPADELAEEIAALGHNCRVITTVEEACDVAIGRAAGESVVVICGSLYTVAAAREHILEGKISP